MVWCYLAVNFWRHSNIQISFLACRRTNGPLFFGRRRRGKVLWSFSDMSFIWTFSCILQHCVRLQWERELSLARYFVNQGPFGIASISVGHVRNWRFGDTGLSSFAFVLFVNLATAVSYFRYVMANFTVLHTSWMLIYLNLALLDITMASACRWFSLSQI